MKFEDLLKEYGVVIEDETTPKSKLLKLQISINETFLSACDDITKKDGVEKQIRSLNKIHKQELLGESSLITNDRRELLDLIDDLLDMINNPHIKLSREQLVDKLNSYREQLKVLEQ
jgi:hypothetical protein